MKRAVKTPPFRTARGEPVPANKRLQPRATGAIMSRRD
jgi:hypothetical protein